ncbi:hypothetical protein [Fibrivirga algicola]|uniref:DUF4292 domain-containing protein n=1 Tax=Fibrivirga algicola TaxID=2950420 RepID=A0ABX0QIZ0_9BACT|nr:hypothetical protein [Fibrivirga algicola]NID12415.1 hypothetical protein [Fibrivirga algicola]
MAWLIACQHVSDRQESATITAEQLTGTYLLTTIRQIGGRPALSVSDDSAREAYARELAYSFYFFSPDSSYMWLRNGQFTKGKYKLAAGDLILGADDYYVVRSGRQSLSMVTDKLINGQVVKFQQKAYRLNFSVDDMRFTSLAKAVFTNPTRPETDAQIRERVKNSLYFYSLFFKTIYTNQFNRFKPAAISMPIRYFRGGTRVIIKFDSTATWTRLYATTADAQKAHALFKQSEKALKRYPIGNSMIHRYSLTLEQMGNNL